MVPTLGKEKGLGPTLGKEITTPGKEITTLENGTGMMAGGKAMAAMAQVPAVTNGQEKGQEHLQGQGSLNQPAPQPKAQASSCVEEEGGQPSSRS